MLDQEQERTVSIPSRKSTLTNVPGCTSPSSEHTPQAWQLRHSVDLGCILRQEISSTHTLYLEFHRKLAFRFGRCQIGNCIDFLLSTFPDGWRIFRVRCYIRYPLHDKGGIGQILSLKYATRYPANPAVQGLDNCDAIMYSTHS